MATLRVPPYLLKAPTAGLQLVSMPPSSGDSSSSNEARPGYVLPPDWDELSPLLDELLDAPIEERAARLAEMSRGNPTRLRELEQLLAEAERGTPLLESSAVRRFDELANDDGASALPDVLADRYRVGREIGRGGMASVYLARDEKHGRDVAIKVIKSDLSASLGHERFLREIEIAARLRHPNIVPLYDSGEVSGSLYFVMPFEDGQSLRERLRQNGALPIGDALSVLRDVARALCYAHEHGVVHRDIKPDNVMLSGGAAVVTDFGIAKAVSAALTDAGDATLTQAGTVIGTPAYMAPEQAIGDAAIDHRADIYSFGCLGYELLAGHPPFQEERSHLLIAAHIATVPRPITELRADVPQPVAGLIAGCLAKAPQDRPQSARELLPILDGAPGVAAPAPTRPPKARSWSRTRVLAAVSIVAAGVATGGYFGTRTASETAPITVAVLPFSNIAGDTAMDFLADGLTDEVASALSRVPGIVVKSRSGARAYRGQLSPDVTEAGARLKADYLMTAVVRQERGSWMLSADFEYAADASTLWDDRFVVSPNDQAATADTIAASLASALRRRFPRAIGIAPGRPPRQQTSNPEAFRLYVIGREKLARRGQSVRETAELFRQAIREDSLFAPAYSGLSIALALSPWFERVRPSEVHDEIVAMAQRALALDSTQSLAHVALGVADWLDFKWARAASEMETAIRLDPRNVEARVQYGRLLRGCGRLDDALNQLRTAAAIDPASALVLSQLAMTYLLRGQMDSALVVSRRAIETDTTNYTSILSGIWANLAVNRLQAARTLAGRIFQREMARGYYLAKSGDVEGARQLLRDLDSGPPEWGDESRRALTYLGLGDTTSALAALARATDDREIWPQVVVVLHTPYDAIRGSARFKVLLTRVGLGEYTSALTR